MADSDYERLQRLLDVIGSQEGSILVRGPDRWIALVPGEIGQVLAIGQGGVPQWVDPEQLDL